MNGWHVMEMEHRRRRMRDREYKVMGLEASELKIPLTPF
jgi:hypothetical protein